MTGNSGQRLEFDEKGEPKLPFQWQQVQSAIWLLGLAILFFTNKWFPGILILIAVSGLTQAAIVAYLRQGEERREQEAARLRMENEARAAEESRATLLPEQCPGCGAPLTAATVLWRSGSTASCPYCQTSIKATRPVAPPAP